MQPSYRLRYISGRNATIARQLPLSLRPGPGTLWVAGLGGEGDSQPIIRHPPRPLIKPLALAPLPGVAVKEADHGIRHLGHRFGAFDPVDEGGVAAQTAPQPD